MNKKLIRLTESDLHRIVKESVKKVLKEQVGLNTIFDEFETDTVCVSDLGLTYQGARIDYVVNNNGKIEFWAGNPISDRFAEQLMLPRQTAKTYMEMIEDEMA